MTSMVTADLAERLLGAVLPAPVRSSGALLIASNLVPLYGVLAWDWPVFYVMALYWAENIVAGLFTLLITDIDVFEAKTGFFTAIGTLVINALVAIVGLLAAFYAISVFFPKRWGPKAGIVGAIVCALVAAFCLRVLLLGGA